MSGQHVALRRARADERLVMVDEINDLATHALTLAVIRLAMADDARAIVPEVQASLRSTLEGMRRVRRVLEAGGAPAVVPTASRAWRRSPGRREPSSSSTRPSPRPTTARSASCRRCCARSSSCSARWTAARPSPAWTVIRGASRSS